MVKRLIIDKVEDIEDLVLDTGKTEFISTIGINALIDVRNKNERDMKIINVNDEIADNFKLT